MQNLELKNKNNHPKTSQEYIKQILNQLLTDYQTIKEERKQLALWEEEQEYTILGIIETFTDDIRGYAFQIINNNSLENNREIVNNLQQLKIFDIIYFSEWYFSPNSNYSQLKRYIETLNYLRLLIIEYLHVP